MSGNKEQRLYELSINIGKILFGLMLVFNAFVFVYYGMLSKDNSLETDPIRFMKDWTTDYNADGDQTVSSVLPQDVKTNEYLFFDTRKDVSVYINGELRNEFIEKRDVNLPGGIYKRFIFSVPLREEDAGAEVLVVRKNLQKVDVETPEFYVGTRSAMLSYLLKTSGLIFVLSFIIMIFSLVAVVVSIVLQIMYKQRIDMLYGALGIFSIAAWMLSDSFLFEFVFGINYVGGFLNFMFSSMIPFGLIIYLSSLQKNRYKKSMAVLMLVSILDAATWTILHISGILPIYKALDAANGVLAFLAACGLVILIVDAVRGNTVSYRYTFIGFLGFLVGCLLELTCILLSVTFRETLFMVIGLAFLLTFIVIQQVHDLRKINMEKQHAIDISEAKTKFLASMSHEIRTPINAILGMNEMILRENNDKAIEEYSRNIKTSGKMLLMLVNDVLDFSKIEAGKLEITQADFLMSDLLYDVVSLVKERAEEKSLTLRTEITGELPNALVSDEFRIRQILINLINNAVKYTETGTVTLSVGGSYTDDGYRLSLLVKDTGKGIKKEDQAHLFEAFSRADVKSNANIEGTGLGLAIVKSIVDSMHGEVGVESEYGVGSAFRVQLPVEVKDREPLRSDFMERKTEEPAQKDSVTFAAPDAKVLAVDDNQSNLTIVKLFLKRNGIVPDLCSSGSRAIELCKEKKYDLILLDHMMPDPDGIETLHRIQNDEASLNRNTAALVLTANAVAGSRQMYLREGFADYLTKPLDSSVLEDAVKKHLPADLVKESRAGAKPVDITEDVIAEGMDVGRANSGEPTVAQSSGNVLFDLSGFDYDTALTYCGGEEELLREIMGDVAAECLPRVERMKKSLAAKDMKAYAIDAHTVKSSMLTIGFAALSERAKKHEFAAKENHIDFVEGDAEAFLTEYAELCEKINAAIERF